jgi:hypothetical protein
MDIEIAINGGAHTFVRSFLTRMIGPQFGVRGNTVLHATTFPETRIQQKRMFRTDLPPNARIKEN